MAELNLLNKLRASFNTAKIAKCVGALVLAGSIALGTISCSMPTNSPFATTDSNYPSTPSSGSNTNEKKHSEMLYNILNDSYYNNLIAKAEENNNLYNSPLFDPHPYAFLEDQGINVDKIKSGEYTGASYSYIFDDEPNNLYIHTRILVDDAYYASYLLKYELTNQEVEDYRTLHGKEKVNRSHYVQSVFLNDEISRTKTPTIFSQDKIDKNFLAGSLKTLQRNSYYSHYIIGSLNSPGNANVAFALANPEERIFQRIFTPQFVSSGPVIRKEIILIETYQHKYNLEYNNGIWKPYRGESLTTKLNSEEKNGTIFNTQDSELQLVTASKYNNLFTEN